MVNQNLPPNDGFSTTEDQLMHHEFGTMTDHAIGAIFYEEVLAEASAWWGKNPLELQRFLDIIAYHESAHTMDPTITQGSGLISEPGKGLFQFEKSIDTNSDGIIDQGGGATAVNRTREHLTKLNNRGVSTAPMPDWVSNSIDPMYGRTFDFDASQLDKNNQYILMISNYREHPDASFKDVHTDEELVDFWIKYHWAGSHKHTQKEIDAKADSFRQSLNKFNKNYPNGYVWNK